MYVNIILRHYRSSVKLSIKECSLFSTLLCTDHCSILTFVKYFQRFLNAVRISLKMKNYFLFIEKPIVFVDIYMEYVYKYLIT